MRRDRLEDALMRRIGELRRTRCAAGDFALFGQPFDHGIIERGEDRIPRNGRDDIVEGDVGAHEVAAVAEGLAVGVERVLQSLDVIRRRDLRR